MAKKKRLNRVKCSKCGKIVAADPIIKTVEKCIACHTKKRPKKSGTVVSAFSRVKKGPALDLPKRYRDKKYDFRSGWERNFARWLCIKGIAWSFEEFDYPMKINPSTGKWYRNKPWGYLPDFLETKTGTIWEVKGYFRSKDRSKIRRWKKHYPEDFKRLKVCLSKTNKVAQRFYGAMNIPMIFIEDVKVEYGRLVAKKKRPNRWE